MKCERRGTRNNIKTRVQGFAVCRWVHTKASTTLADRMVALRQ